MTAKSQPAGAAPGEKPSAAPEQAQAEARVPGLFERWISLEKAKDKTMGSILAELNEQAGTSYKHNWPSVVASRGYELERCPITVRRIMMRAVLEDELKKMGCKVSQSQLASLTHALT